MTQSSTSHVCPDAISADSEVQAVFDAAPADLGQFTEAGFLQNQRSE